MREGIEKSSGEIIIFLDADIETLEASWIDRLSEPIEEGRADVVKASYDYKGEDFVTQCIARPLLGFLFPEADCERPIEGEIAMRREVLDDIEILDGFRAESGMIIDLYLNAEKVEEINLGKKKHGERTGEALKFLAEEVQKAILTKALEYKRI